MTPETVKLIFEVASAIGRRLWLAFEAKDHKEVRRLADVLPEPLRSQVALRFQEELARQEFGGSKD